MPTPNNITQDWNSVLRTATKGLEVQNQTIAILAANTKFLEGRLAELNADLNRYAAALKQAKADGDTARISQFERLYDNAADVEARTRNEISANTRQIQFINTDKQQYQTQINEANAQLAIQAKGTTPATNATLAATVTPASAKPGNPNVATTPVAAPTSTPKPATNVTNTTNTTTATAAATVVKNATPATTSAPNTTGTTPPASTTGSATPGAPAKEPKTVLKFGDEIDDIYDKTLTPEQIASLSPGDRKAREAYLKDSTSNADTAQQEIVVTATKSAVEFETQAQATAQDQANFEAFEDWRVRLTLAPDAEYLYRAGNPGILAPLAATDGVIFPYTPLISVNYQATYDASTIVHSNYKIYQYTNSAVDQVTISCDFTAQDTSEANYLLATIHFFRSMTKMFYGQDQYPKPGTPPPLCFLFGLGGFQFEAHPLVITGFSYNLPNDVDYIRTTTTIDSTSVTKNGYFETAGNGRLPTGVLPGGVAAGPTFDTDGQGFTPTYVPTKIQLSITCYPIVTRNQISNEFSLTDYATGKLLQGSKRQGGGIW